MSSAAIGVLTEDATDGDTVRILIQRLRHPERIAVKTRAAGGCGEIKRKGVPWARDLERAGCSALVVVCDLDRDAQGQLRNEPALRQRLETLELPAGLRRHVCIPVEEIEAWFWADQALLDRIGSPGAVRAHAQPHCIRQPKEALIRLSRDGQRRARYSTLDNPAYAKSLDLKVCAQRCPSFRALRDFIAQL